MHELADQLLDHLKATWHYRWYAVVFAWLIALGGWIAVYLMPDRYEASARVYVDTESMLRPLLFGLVVPPNVDQMVAMMSATLVSRPNLEKVIRMADMDIGLKTSEDREQLIARLSREVVIKGAGKVNLYTIAYGDKNPEEAKQVVQSFLSLFVEDSLGDKRKDSDSARRFIDEQLTGYSERLVAAESAVTEFKRRHMGLMPGEGPSYFARLIETKAALSQAALGLNEAEDVRDSIKKQLASESESEISSLPDDMAVSETANPELDARIRALEQKLDALRLTYTEQHPDIVALVPTIARLKEQKEAEAKVRESLPSAARAKGPVYQQLTVALTTAEANVAAMKTRLAEYSKRYAELQAAANAVPQVEAEYKQLTRDYEVNKARYDELLKRRESAQISGDMATDASFIDFRVVDPPQVRLSPKVGSRPLLMSLVLLAALGGGGGVAFLISQIRPTMNDERRLREVTGLQVLGTVVMAWTDAQKAHRIRSLVAFLLSFASLLSAYAAIMAALLLPAARI